MMKATSVARLATAMILIWCVPVFALQVRTPATLSNDLVVPSVGAVSNAGTVTHPALAQAETTTMPSVVVSNEVLVVYNRNVPDSVACKDYYINHRPGFSGANVLATSCTTFAPCGSSYYDCPVDNSFEGITTNNLVNQIITPITNFISSHPEKSIKYIVLMYGMPSRTTNLCEQSRGGFHCSVQHSVARCLSGWRSAANGPYYDDGSGWNKPVAARYQRASYSGTSLLVTSLNMGSLADVRAYIDKVAKMYRGDLIISAKSAGYHNDNYYVDNYTPAYSSYSQYMSHYPSAIHAVNPGASVSYTVADPHFKTGSNVAAYISWGKNATDATNHPAYLGGGYMTNAVVWSGDSGWWICETIESFNGQRCAYFQGSVRKWYLPNSWGGVGYANTPVGAVSHVEEPGLGGQNDSLYMSMWEAGYTFAECAWRSKHTPAFQAIGDPLVRK
jgi:hypothetical protein